MICLGEFTRLRIRTYVSFYVQEASDGMRAEAPPCQMQYLATLTIDDIYCDQERCSGLRGKHLQ